MPAVSAISVNGRNGAACAISRSDGKLIGAPLATEVRHYHAVPHCGFVPPYGTIEYPL